MTQTKVSANGLYYKNLDDAGWIQAGALTSGTITISNDLVSVASSYSSIDTGELEELKDDSALLYALIDAGVEEWPGYKEAVAAYLEQKRKN